MTSWKMSQSAFSVLVTPGTWLMPGHHRTKMLTCCVTRVYTQSRFKLSIKLRKSHKNLTIRCEGDKTVGRNLNELGRIVVERIGYYNCVRRHSSLGYRPLQALMRQMRLDCEGRDDSAMGSVDNPGAAAHPVHRPATVTNATVAGRLNIK